jgi:hypothetical protein
MNDPTNCPNCNTSFIGEDILEGLRNSGYYDNLEDDELRLAAAMYGWTPDNGKTFTKDCTYIKHIYDDVPNYYQCNCCGYKIY